jgi:fluoroquinolone transport system permease protein
MSNERQPATSQSLPFLSRDVPTGGWQRAIHRLRSTLQLDLRLQKRYGLMYAAAFVTIVWVVLLRQLPHESLPLAVPFVIFVDLAIVGFYFIAGMVLFEKDEHTLSAMVVTPLRFWEYLLSKVITLTALALVASLTLALATYGVGFNLPLLALGTILTSLIGLLLGYISIAPFNTISSYWIPSQFYLMFLGLPIIDYFGWWPSAIFYLLPTHGSLLLLYGAFDSIAAWQIVYAVVYQLAWAGLLGWLAYRAFERHIVAREGAH